MFIDEHVTDPRERGRVGDNMGEGRLLALANTEYGRDPAIERSTTTRSRPVAQ